MRGLPRRFLTIALIALLAVPAAADAKNPKRHPVSVDVEFSFTGLTEYKLDSSGTSLTCPDDPNPYKFEDHVRAHIAWDTVWKVRIPLNAARLHQVHLAKKEKLGGSTWSISGKTLSDQECVPPQDYSCSGTFRVGAKAPIAFAPVEGNEWRAIMQGPGGTVASPDGCEYAGIHRRIQGELPDELIERATGAFQFTTHRLLKLKNKTFTGEFDYGSIPSDCGSDDTVTCTQSAEGSGGFRYHRLKINYKP